MTDPNLLKRNQMFSKLFSHASMEVQINYENIFSLEGA